MTLKEVRSTVYAVADVPMSSPSASLTDTELFAFLLRTQFDLATDPQENLVALYLTSRLKPIAAQPRDIVRGALLSNAVHVVVAHNHPSGDPTPSPDDIEYTRNLQKLLALFEIGLHDHIILAGTRHYSMAERGFFSRWAGG